MSKCLIKSWTCQFSKFKIFRWSDSHFKTWLLNNYPNPQHTHKVYPLWFRQWSIPKTDLVGPEIYNLGKVKLCNFPLPLFSLKKFLPVVIFKMATTIPHKFNIVRFQRPELIPDIEKFLPVSIFNIVRFQR